MVNKAIKEIDPRIVEHNPFISAFPPANIIASSVYGAYGDKFTEWYIMNVQDLSKLSYGRMLWKWDAGSKEIGDFAELVNKFDEIPIGEFTEAWDAILSGKPLDIADEILDLIGPLWAMVGTSADFYSEVPILGIFVALGKFCVNLAQTARKSIASIHYPIEGIKMEYDRESDTYIVNSALQALKEKDWTGIFSPPTAPVFGEHDDPRGASIEHTNVKWKEGAGQGALLTVRGGRGKFPSTGFGFHPQTARIPIAWQYPTGNPKKRKTRKKWTFKRGLKVDVDGFETYHPATQQISVLLWERLLKNRPEIYRVDAAAIRSSWTMYFKAMEEYLTRKPDEYGMGDTAEYVRPMTQGVIERILAPEYWGPPEAIEKIGTVATSEGIRFKWKILGKEVPIYYYTFPDKIVSKGLSGGYEDYDWRQAKRGGTPGIDLTTGEEKLYGLTGPRLTARGLTEFIIDESLKKRQWNYLNTLTIAYLTPDMPAFRNWPELLDKFHKNREILLTHQARIWVDLDRVPDGPWKVKLKQSLKGIPPGMKYTAPMAKIKANVSGGKAVLPGKEEDAGNPIPLIPKMVKMRAPEDEKAGGGGGGIAIAAAAGLGLMMMKGKK